MQTTTLGPVTVSRLCLGAMLMGGATPVDESHRILDRFLDAGGTFIDTADVYGDGDVRADAGAVAGAAPR